MSPPHMHLCSVPECGKVIPDHLLMCKRHWIQVPGKLRQQVLDRWKLYQNGECELEHLRAAQILATNSVEAAEPPVCEPVRRCRVCGCTDDDCRKCIEATGQPCAWVEGERDLCTRCAEPGVIVQTHVKRRKGGAT